MATAIAWQRLCGWMNEKAEEGAKRRGPGDAESIKAAADHFCRFQPKSWREIEERTDVASRLLYGWDAGFGTQATLTAELEELLADLRPTSSESPRPAEKGPGVRLSPKRCSMCEDVGWVDKLDRELLLAKVGGDEEILRLTDEHLFGEQPIFADLILLKTDTSGVGSEYVIGHPFYINARFWSFMPSMVWAELFLLLCTKDRKYAEYRYKFRKAGSKSTPVVLSVISGAVAQRYSVAVAGCVPFVAAALACLVKVGTEAVCQTIRKNVPPLPDASPEAPARKKAKKKAKRATEPKSKKKGT